MAAEMKPGKRVYVAAACLSLIGLVADGVISLRPEEGQGFVERPVCVDESTASAPAGERTVSEPVILPGHAKDTDAPCKTWTSYFRAERRTGLQMMLDTNANASISIDGQPLISATPLGPHRSFADTDLTSGVHRVEVRFERATPSDYLRVYALDIRGPRAWGMAPLDYAHWFTSESSAETYRPGLMTQTRPIRALAFLAVLVLALVGLARSRIGIEPLDVKLALAVTALAALVRIPASLSQEVLYDEHAYWKGGRHFFRNLWVGDFRGEAWSWNFEHPPLSKWLAGAVDLFGGFPAVRVASAGLASLAVGIVYLLGRRLTDSRVGGIVGGIVAAVCLALTPRVVAHSRIVSLGGLVLFFWVATLYAMARLHDRKGGSQFTRRDALAITSAVCLSVVAFGIKATGALVAIPAAAIFVRALHQRPVAVKLRSIATVVVAALVALGLLLISWTYLWTDPEHSVLARLQETGGHFGAYLPSEYYLGRLQRPPPPIYFAHAFFATTPEIMLIAGSLGIVALAMRRKFGLLVILLLCLCAPFIQSFFNMRRDISRYVVFAWPGLCLLCGAFASEASEALLALEKRFNRGEWPPWIRFTPAAIVIAGMISPLYAIEPYPLTYFNTFVGGPKRIQRRHVFEVAAWAHGLDACVGYLNRKAEDGATIYFPYRAPHTPRLRDELDEVMAIEDADFVVIHQLEYRADRFGTPPGCREVFTNTVRGAVLARVLACGSRHEP